MTEDELADLLQATFVRLNIQPQRAARGMLRLLARMCVDPRNIASFRDFQNGTTPREWIINTLRDMTREEESSR